MSLLAGSIGTMLLMLRAGGTSRPLILVPLFAAWDISPFVLLWLADRFSNRWSGPARAALYWVMVVVSTGTVAYYISDVFWPRQTQPAFPYVIAPPVAWVFSAMVLGAAPLVSRKS